MDRRSIIFIKSILLLIALVFTVDLAAQEKPAYRLYRGDGSKVKYSKMMKELEKADFVFFGELHNNPIAHWLQLEVTRDLHAVRGEAVVLGAEMFEADDQFLIEEFFRGFINAKRFEEDARLWPNYKTDYSPLLLLAKENSLPFIATNIPRRYASFVASKGLEALDSLPAEAKRFIAPLPIEFDPEVPCYKNMLEMGGMGSMGAHGGMNIVKAQAIKDATMAHFINLNYQPGNQFIHYNGSYHSDNHEGIVWYLRKLQPDARIIVLTTVTQEEVDKLADESKGKADYIIAVPERMTTTY
ncbi:MAG: ChaN family lipoprotein [Bacteroidales bacterium]